MSLLLGGGERCHLLRRASFSARLGLRADISE
jgi:hypothetical protein